MIIPILYMGMMITIFVFTLGISFALYIEFYFYKRKKHKTKEEIRKFDRAFNYTHSIMMKVFYMWAGLAVLLFLFVIFHSIYISFV